MPIERRRCPNLRKKWAELIIMFGSRCAYCHEAIATQIDHVIPFSHSYDHSLENLRPCCEWCNFLAGDKVFAGFDEKYTFLIKKRASKRKNKNALLTCTICLLPYYSAMHPNALLCPHCYAVEYGIEIKNGGAWVKWIQTLKDAGIDFDAHQEMLATASQISNRVNKFSKTAMLIDILNRRDEEEQKLIDPR